MKPWRSVPFTITNRPLPIVHKFGQPNNTAVLEAYYHKAMREQYLAQFSAYMFWDYEWNSIKRRQQANRDFRDRTTKQ